MKFNYYFFCFTAFCYSFYDDIVKARKKHCYADECCIAPGELESDNDVEIPPTQHQVQQNRRNLLQQNLLAENNNESREFPMTKISPKTKSQNPSIVKNTD